MTKVLILAGDAVEVLEIFYPYLRLKEDNAGNLIISGHIASDSVGINPFLDRLEKEGLEVLRMGGVIPPSV